MAATRRQPNSKRHDQARTLRTVIGIKERYLFDLLEQATEKAQEAKRTGNKEHLREAMRLRDSATHLAKRIEDSKRRLDSLQ